MQLKHIIYVAALVPLLTIQCSYGQQDFTTRASFSQVGHFQGNGNTQDDEQLDLAEEFKKLEYRLRELEDDYSQHSDDAVDDEKSTKKQSKGVDTSIKELQEDVESLTEAVDDIDSSLPGLVVHAHKNPKITFFGRVHIDYWAFPKIQPGIFALEPGDPQDRFNFRRLRIGVKGDLNDNMFYKYEGEFAGGNNPSYRDAYLGWKNLPFFNKVIIGNHKRPYSLDHLNSSNHNVFIERPFSIEAFNQDNRRLGISSSGYSCDLKQNWRYGIWNHRLTQNGSGYVGDHYQPEIASRRAFTPWYDECSGGRGYFHFGLASSIAFPNGRGGVENDARYRTRPEARTSGRWLDTGRIVGANTLRLTGVESVLNLGAFQAVAEWQRVDVDRTGPIGTDLTFHGGYFQFSYFLTGEHIPWNRKTGTIGRVKPFENFFRVRDCNCNVQRGMGAWQIAARYSYADLNDLDIVGGDGEALTVGLNWHWNERARMQFNYIIGDIKREPIGSGDYEIFGVRFMVDF